MKKLKGKQILEKLEAEAEVLVVDTSPLGCVYAGASVLLNALVDQGHLSKKQGDYMDSNFTLSWRNLSRKMNKSGNKKSCASPIYLERLKEKQARGSIDEVSFMIAAGHTIRMLAEQGILSTRDADTLEGAIIEYLCSPQEAAV